MTAKLVKILGMVLLAGVMIVAVNADPEEKTGQAHHKDGVPTPFIPKAKGETCVEPADVMRRMHSAYLRHQRDDTMHRGIRTTKYSLVECIECHVTPDENGFYKKIHQDPQHFCRSCHAYSAVTPDCFQCHTSVPMGAKVLEEEVAGH